MMTKKKLLGSLAGLVFVASAAQAAPPPKSCAAETIDRVLGMKLPWLPTLVGLAEQCPLPVELRLLVRNYERGGRRFGIFSEGGALALAAHLPAVCPNGVRVLIDTVRDTAKERFGPVFVERCGLDRFGIGPQPIALEPMQIAASVGVAGWLAKTSGEAQAKRVLQHLLSAPRANAGVVKLARRIRLDALPKLPEPPGVASGGSGVGGGGAGGPLRFIPGRAGGTSAVRAGSSRTVWLRKAPPKVSGPDLVLPRLAIDEGIEGKVFLLVTIDESGKVKRVRVIKSLPVLAPACASSVRRWTFEAPQPRGKDATFRMACRFPPR